MDVLAMPGWRAVDHQRVEQPGAAATRLLVIAPTEIVVPKTCPKCGGSDVRVSSQRAHAAVDAPLYGDRVKLSIMRPRFRCESSSAGRRCGHVMLHPLPEGMTRRSRFTTRCAGLIHREQATFRPVGRIATELGIGESSVRGLISYNRETGPKIVLPPPRYLGIDEVELRDLADDDRPHERRKRAVFVDLEAGQIIALLDDNDLQSVGVELARLAEEARRAGQSIRGVAGDFHLPYRRAVAEQIGKTVPFVIDRFHVEDRLHRALDAVRVRELRSSVKPRPGFLQKDTVRMFAGMLWAKNIPNQPNRSNLFRQYLSFYPDTAAAYHAKQDFKAMWGRRCSSAEAFAAFETWKQAIPASIKKEFDPFTNFIEKHRKPVFKYFDLSISNGLGENRNGRIRDIMRSSKRLYLATLRGKLMDHAHLAYQAPRTYFCCDGCGDRTPDYPGKVGSDPHPLDRAEMWLCPSCKTDPLRSSPRPLRKPSPRRRRLQPDLPQAGLVLLNPADAASSGGL